LGLLHFLGFGLLLELGGKSKLVVVVVVVAAAYVVWHVTHKHWLVGNSHRATFYVGFKKSVGRRCSSGRQISNITH
jgi:hydrogenase/urease accessory protein HupE